jgi:predicted nucleic acid-binding protein
MIVHLDTSVLVDALTGPRRSAAALEHGARVWTLNQDDFRDIPGIKLCEPV